MHLLFCEEEFEMYVLYLEITFQNVFLYFKIAIPKLNVYELYSIYSYLHITVFIPK